MPDDRGIWIFAERGRGTPDTIAAELLTRAGDLASRSGEEVTAVLVGSRIPSAYAEEVIARGADRVLAVEHPSFPAGGVQPYAAVLERLARARRPSVILAAATTTGRTVMPYLAVRLHTGLTADCTDLDLDPDTGDLLQTRPAIGGNIMATIRTARHRPQMATVRPHSAPPREADPSREGVVERLTVADGDAVDQVTLVNVQVDEDDRHLQDADIVVSVGRGIRSPDNLGIVRDLAEVLGAALGATRDVVDRGWLPYPHQVGLSGKTVTPRLYIAVGLSGSIQHLAGMQTSERIIAINDDPDAQIFRVAELGLVGDLFEIVPALTDCIRNGQPVPGINTGTA